MAPRSDRLDFVVLDGESPADWRPWNQALSVLKQHVESDDLVLVDAERQHKHFEIGLLLHEPQLLRTREQKHVVSIVGVIVDGISYMQDPRRAKAIQDDFDMLCNKLAGAGPAGLLRRVGFYVLVVVNAPLNDEFARCRFELDKAATFALGPEVARSVIPIRGDDYLLSAIQTIEVQMAATHKRWLAQTSAGSV